MTWRKQFFLLVWKNVKLKSRNATVLFLELAIPALFAGVLYEARWRMKRERIKGNIFYPEPLSEHFSNYYMKDDSLPATTDFTVGFFPVTNSTEEVMRLFSIRSGLDSLALPSRLDAMVKIKSNAMLAAVEFETDANGAITQRAKFNVMMSSQLLLHLGEIYPHPEPPTPICKWVVRARTRLLYALGQSLTRYWVMKSGRDPFSMSLKLSAKCMPNPPHSVDSMLRNARTTMPMFLVYPFLLSVGILTKEIVTEKEKKLKETLKLMGLKMSAYWASWLVTFLIFFTPAVGIFTTIFFLDTENGPLFGGTSISLFVAFLLCYGLAMVTFSFLISAVFQKANHATALTALLFLFMSLPGTTLDKYYHVFTKGHKLVYCLFFPLAMFLGMLLMMSEITSADSGLTWDTFYHPAAGDNVSLMDVMLMLLLDSCLHCVLAAYLDLVYPGDTGVPLPPWFCFTKSYWFPSEEDDDHVYHTRDEEDDSRFFEPDPQDLKTGIAMHKLRKVYGKKAVVRGTTLNMYEGQITALLGHNGAGKTVTMCMLTGFTPPTSGTAVINGHDIRTHLPKVRSCLGLCPQFNILFDSLTVSEHLYFFSRIKGVSHKNEEENTQLLEAVGLDKDKSQTFTKKLSGGQKRMLSVAIALLGDSKVVILDEPTAGMDPAARRTIWTLLKEARNERTILLTTHYMDEADMLGDRIAIMSEGQIKCCGTPMFLKKLYGSGYRLIVHTTPECDKEKLLNKVQSYVEEAFIESVVSDETTIILPDQQSSKFPSLFSSLEVGKDDLNIISFGISTTSMEEVFLKVDSGEEKDDLKRNVFAEGTTSEIEINDGEPIQPDIPQGKESVEDLKASGAQTPRDGKDLGTLEKEVELGCSSTSVDGFSRKNLEGGPQTPRDGKDLGTPKKKVELGCSSTSVDGFSRKNLEVKIQRLAKKPISRKLKKAAKLISALSEIVSKEGGHKGQKVWALVVKRAILCCRNKLYVLGQLLLPFMVIYKLTSVEKGPSSAGIRRTMDMSAYEPAIVPFTPGYNASLQDVRLAEAYADQFNDQPLVRPVWVYVPKEASFDDYIMNEIEEVGIQLMKHHTPVGMEVQSPSSPLGMKMCAYHSYFPYYARDVSIMLALNAFMKASLNNSYQIEASLESVEMTFEEVDSSTPLDMIVFSRSVAYCFTVIMGMSFVSFFTCHVIILERVTGNKRMQMMSGANSLIYWLASLLTDFFLYTISAGLVFLVLQARGEPSFTEPDGHWALLVVALALFGWANLSMVYFMQFFLSTPGTGAIYNIIFSFLVGMAFAMVSMLLTLMKGLQISRETFIVWRIIFATILPAFSLSALVQDVYANFENTKLCATQNCSAPSTLKVLGCCQALCHQSPDGPRCFRIDTNENYLAFDYPGIAPYLLIMALQGFFYLTLVIAIDFNWFSLLRYYLTSDVFRGAHAKVTDFPGEDQEVAEERKRVLAKPLEFYKSQENVETVNLVNLYKCFGANVVVDHLCLGLVKGECFGLLGHNGAGKTTSFKTIIGEELATAGHAYVMRKDVIKDLMHARTYMGYCPQFDGLLNEFTGRETLTMIARLRGIPEKSIPEMIDVFLEMMLFKHEADNLSGLYSGGTKRKLIISLTMVGSPPVLLLDEPTWGVDANARRHVWDTLAAKRDHGSTIVLTSHSMEECEALCTRIGIMVCGRLVCLGSPQFLRSKFGKGYTFIIQVAALSDGTPAPTKPIVDFITTTFKGSKLFEEHQNYLHFKAPESMGQLSNIFAALESVKEELHIQDYSVQQATLEQVFLDLTRDHGSSFKDTSREWRSRIKTLGTGDFTSNKPGVAEPASPIPAKPPSVSAEPDSTVPERN